jgi:hypothetical protein
MLNQPHPQYGQVECMKSLNLIPDFDPRNDP